MKTNSVCLHSSVYIFSCIHWTHVKNIDSIDKNIDSKQCSSTAEYKVRASNYDHSQQS